VKGLRCSALAIGQLEELVGKSKPFKIKKRSISGGAPPPFINRCGGLKIEVR
jgi:hypothetical protein